MTKAKKPATKAAPEPQDPVATPVPAKRDEVFDTPPETEEEAEDRRAFELEEHNSIQRELGLPERVEPTLAQRQAHMAALVALADIGGEEEPALQSSDTPALSEADGQDDEMSGGDLEPPEDTGDDDWSEGALLDDDGVEFDVSAVAAADEPEEELTDVQKAARAQLARHR